MSTDQLDGREALAHDREEDEVEDRSRMSFLDHLDELRRRIIYSLYALIVSCAVTFYFWQELYEFLVRYFLANGGKIVFTRPMAGFIFSLKISLLGGLLIASPFIFSQLWFFVAPGLYAKEKRMAIPFVFFSTVLFLSGATFAHYLAFPAMWKFFVSYQIGGVEMMSNLDDTFSLYIRVLLGLGLVFQMPMLVFVLARFGVVTAKFMVAKFKYAVLGIFIIAALITPSADIVTQLLFAGPMTGLYVVSIGVAWLFGKKRDASETV